MPPSRTRDDWSAANNCFQVDDAERLIFIYRWTGEDAGAAVELNRFRLCNHLLDPDDMRTEDTGLLHFFPHLGCDLRGIGCSHAQDNLSVGRQIMDRLDEMSDFLLSRKTHNEQDVCPRRIYTVCDESCDVPGFLIFLQIYSVVNDMNAFRRDFGYAR